MYSIGFSSPSCCFIKWSSSSEGSSSSVSVPFMQSIKEIIPHATLITSNKIELFATKIEPLTETTTFDYKTAVRFAECISRQILYMEKRAITFIGFDLKDILSIENGRYFVVANFSRVISCANHNIQFSAPFYKPQFTTLNIQNIQRLPAVASHYTARYSLGLLVCSLISIDTIRYTKLYWFLKRCLETPAVGFVIV